MISSFTDAFPAKLTLEVNRLSELLDTPSDPNPSGVFAVRCDGELLQIPNRIYQPAISESQFASLSSVEQAAVACWFTRHHDGHVRERFLRALPAFDASWVISYILPLCGEYVVELLYYIWDHRTLFDVFVLSRWLRDNPELYSRTRRRVVSYWNCYHRMARLEDYVGSQLIAFFEEAVSMRA